MTEEDKKHLSSFEKKLRHFMFLYEELEQENARLKKLMMTFGYAIHYKKKAILSLKII